jgi:hypothetical protein
MVVDFKDDKTVLLNHEKEVSHPTHKPGRLHVVLKDCHYCRKIALSPTDFLRFLVNKRLAPIQC